MPDPKFTKSWHGVPREDIHWNPTIIEDACIGCGTCVTGCSRLVYRYDFERKKPVVVDPLNFTKGDVLNAMEERKIDKDRVHLDSFGI